MVKNYIKLAQRRANKAIDIAVEYFKNPTVSQRLIDSVQYSLLNGGKRVRAALLYACGDALGVPNGALDKAVVAIEMIHAYSLIHDDLPEMDNDDLRRGQPTNHIQFDVATAILAGDALQAMAYEYISLIDEVDPKKVLKTIHAFSYCSGLRGMVAGQMLDIAAENNEINLKQLENIHHHKTGDLLTAALLMAFHLSQYSENDHVEKVIRKFAKYMGLAFQIQDDILDVTSNTEVLGKEVGHDISANKQTYPSLIGIGASEDLLREYYYESICALDEISVDLTTLKEIAAFIINRKH